MRLHVEVNLNPMYVEVNSEMLNGSTQLYAIQDVWLDKVSF